MAQYHQRKKKQHKHRINYYEGSWLILLTLSDRHKENHWLNRFLWTMNNQPLQLYIPMFQKVFMGEYLFLRYIVISPSSVYTLSNTRKSIFLGHLMEKVDKMCFCCITETSNKIHQSGEYQSYAYPATLANAQAQIKDVAYQKRLYRWCKKTPKRFLLSRLMTKPTKWVCAQRRLRSARASSQSDQSSLCAQWVAKDPRFLHADSEDWSDWADTKADLSLRWAQSHNVGFVMRRLILI